MDNGKIGLEIETAPPRMSARFERLKVVLIAWPNERLTLMNSPRRHQASGSRTDQVGPVPLNFGKLERGRTLASYPNVPGPQASSEESVVGVSFGSSVCVGGPIVLGHYRA